MMHMATSSSLTTTAAATRAQLFNTYHQQLLREFTANIRENINIRLDAVEQIVNLGLPDCFDRFEIQKVIRDEIMVKIEPEIDDKTKVQHKSCTKQINSIKDYRNVARNRLNRNKPKFLGNFVFGEIIFSKLYPHIYQQCNLHKLQSVMIMKIFMTILISIFENHAQFTQTKPQPIITYNTLVNENLFKSGCINLLKHYQIPAQLYQTEKRKSSKKKAKASAASITANKPKEPAKRDKAKMAYQKIVDAMKLINTDQKLMSAAIPEPGHIITGHDTRKNKTYRTMCITPPSIPSPPAINININNNNNNNNNGYNMLSHTQPQTFFPHQGQYQSNTCCGGDGGVSQTNIVPVPGSNMARPDGQIPVLNNTTISFGSTSNMQHNTHFVVHPDGNLSSSGDEMQTASTNSSDRDQNISLCDGISRGNSSSSTSTPASHSTLPMHIPESNIGNNIDGNNNNYNDSYGVNTGVVNVNQYNQNQCAQNEYPVGNGPIIMDQHNYNTYTNNQQSQPIYNNDTNGMVFNDEYKQTTQITHNNTNDMMNMNTNMNNNYNNMNISTFNNGLNNFNNGNMTADNQCGVMLSGADLSTNNVHHINSNNIGININNSNNNSYNGLQYVNNQQQIPMTHTPSFHNNGNDLLLPQTQTQTQTQTKAQTPEMSQYGHHYHNNTSSALNRNIMNNVNESSIYNVDNNMMNNNNNLASTNVFGGFDTNSIAMNNVNVNLNAFDTNSISMNNMNNMNNNLSTNQPCQAPIIIDDEVNSNPINSNMNGGCTGYGASRGRSTSTIVRSHRFSPLSVPAPRTEPVTISNPFNAYTSTTNLNNNNNIINNINRNNNDHYQVPFPFSNNINNNRNNSINYNNNNNNNNNGVYTQNYGNY